MSVKCFLDFIYIIIIIFKKTFSNQNINVFTYASCLLSKLLDFQILVEKIMLEIKRPLASELYIYNISMHSTTKVVFKSQKCLFQCNPESQLNNSLNDNLSLRTWRVNSGRLTRCQILCQESVKAASVPDLLVPFFPQQTLFLALKFC